MLIVFFVSKSFTAYFNKSIDSNFKNGFDIADKILSSVDL